ncbi:MAG: hypothetical protein ABJO86_13125 [Lentilitoribacter sp.]
MMAENLDSNDLKKRLLFAMAESVDEVQNLEDYLDGDDHKIEFGYAPADGSLAPNLALLISYAEITIQFLSDHGLSTLNNVATIAALYEAYKKRSKEVKNDYTEQENKKILAALQQMLDEQKPS